MSSILPTQKIWDLAIIGAGPVGLEAAAQARERGLETLLIESGVVGQNVSLWGAVQLFTPFELNAGPAGLRALGEDVPRAHELLTGEQFRARYLIPLSTEIRKSVELMEGARVVSISREQWLKGEALGSAERSTQPFRILVEAEGTEREIRAQRIFDCSGSYHRPNWAGPGGTPARGERALREKITYHLPDLLGADRHRFTGVRTLLIGGGHSAGTAALALADLAHSVEGTCFTWATRNHSPPLLDPIADDPLPERVALAERVRALASALPDGCRRLAPARLIGIEEDQRGFRVELEHEGSPVTERFDRILALVGYEPDDRLYRQLQIHECYASRGPMNLAAALLGAGATGAADCLVASDFGPDTLRNPEPDFFILGVKSYGKNSQFIMRTGYEQIADVFGLFTSAPTS